MCGLKWPAAVDYHPNHQGRIREPTVGIVPEVIVIESEQEEQESEQESEVVEIEEAEQRANPRPR